MPGALSMRLLSVLQLTRMALVFTAIADGACSLLLLWRSPFADTAGIDANPAANFAVVDSLAGSSAKSFR